MYLGIGKQIRKYRKNKDLTMEQLAKKVGVTAQAISQYERDLRVPSNEIMLKISKSLDINIILLYPSDAFEDIEYILEILIKLIKFSLKDDSTFTIEDLGGFTSKEVFEVSNYLHDYINTIINNRKNNLTPRGDITFKLSNNSDSPNSKDEDNINKFVEFRII